MQTINSEEVLLNFLTTGLIDVKGDDDKLLKLQEVATELATKLEQTPELTLDYVLVALDPDAAPDNNTVTTVLNMLSQHWLTYRNTFKETPIQVVRAILLEALVRAMPANDYIALILAICARNLLPHRELSHEQDIWTKVLFTAEQQVDERAAKEWTTPSQINIPDFNIDALEPIKIKQPFIDIVAEEIKMDCMAVAGRTYYDGNTNVAVPNGNRYIPQNSNSQWVTEFGSKLANLLATNINKATDGAVVEEVDLAVPITCISDALTEHLDTTFRSFAAATSGLERRTNLLWWKEAMYSSSIRTSYRTLTPQSAATVMAYDLYSQLPCFSPASVAAFLHEAVHSLNNTDKDTYYTITEFVKIVNNDDRLTSLRSAIEPLLPTISGRGLIIELFAKNVTDTATLVLGVNENTKLTIADWAQWLLGDLMVLKAVAQTKEVAS